MSKPVRVLLIVAFVLVDVALGVAAWRHVQREPKASDIDLSRVSAAPEPAGGAQASQPFELEPSNMVMVDASAAGTVIVARRGACRGEAPTVRVSLNQGRTLQPVNPNVSEVLGVAVDDGAGGGALIVVGTDADCAPVAKRSTDDGRTWEDVPTIDGWYAGIGNLTTLVTPDGASKPGCAVSSLSVVGATFGRVSCTDGRIRGTGDGGKTWTTLGKLVNLRAASFDDFSNGTALARHEGCADYAFVTSDGGRTWKPRGCVGGGAAQALTSDGTRLVAVVDDKIAVTTDRGKSWTIHEPSPTSEVAPGPSPSPTPSTSPSLSPTPTPTEDSEDEESEEEDTDDEEDADE